MELDMSRYIHGQPGNFDEIRILVEGGASYTSDIDFQINWLHIFCVLIKPMPKLIRSI